MFDPSFSEHSHGFRTGRNAHGAVCEAQQYIQDGKRVVVDVDLEKFFDRVNHKELERRGLSFVRYADDLNVYVGSWRAGNDAMETLRRLFGQLRLRVNEAKSAVARPWSRKFLGYSFWVAKGGEVKRKVATKALEEMKHRTREITDRNGGRSMKTVFAELRSYLAGRKEYFGLAETPGIFRGLDEWIRHGLRMVATQTVEAAKDGIPSADWAWGASVAREPGGHQPQLVEKRLQSVKQRTAHKLLRPNGSTETCSLTSTF